MAATKKKASLPSKTRSSSSAKPTLKKVKGENFYHNAKAVGYLKMRSGGKPVYGRDGKIVQAAAFQKGEDETVPGRVQPDRRWFGNTRVISQSALDHFRTSLQKKVNDPFSVLLRSNKLPMGLVDEAANPHTQKRPHIVETEPFGDTFGPKAQRKKPRLDVSSFEELSKLGAAADEQSSDTLVGTDAEGAVNDISVGQSQASDSTTHPQTHADYIEPIYSKGTSRRIYGELYKVIDSSDVILHVLDARDPLGTMCQSVLDFIKKEKAHKQVVLIINKCDLVPNWVTARYIQHLTPRYPTLAFHASPNHSFGKGSLIQLLRQFSQLHSDKKQISVGFIGYPNVGKSSVINTLKSGKVCRVAPIPGETKVWQYITMTRRIYLIDCPGVVPSSAHDTQTSTVLKGVVRVEALPTPSEHIPALMARVKPRYLARTYGVPLPVPDDPTQTWEPEQFLDALARMKGRLLKGGEPDVEGVARIVLSDWVRGRIPFFVAPPERPAELDAADARGRPDRKGKGKATEPRVPGVTQKLRGIIQKNTFVGDDVRPMEETEGPSVMDEAEDENEDDVEESKVADNEDEVEESKGADEEGAEEVGEEGAGDEETEEAMTWEDAFGTSSGGNKEEEAEGRDHRKEPRMTTSKRKPSNFFTHANVKNKNRSKVRPVVGRGRSKSRVGEKKKR